ncbi:hypothetical protein ACFLTE_11365 [Bacteroidota bacterium]
MKTERLNKQDRKIIIKRIYPIIFNIIIALVFGILLIIVFPVIVKIYSQLDNDVINAMQLVLIIILLTLSLGYYLSKSKNQRKDLKESSKISKRQKLLDKKKTPKRNYIIYTPENIEDNNIYELIFENAVLVVNREIFDKLEINNDYDLFYSPICNIFLNITDEAGCNYYNS